MELPSKSYMEDFLSNARDFPHLAIDIERDPVTYHFLGLSLAYKKNACYFSIEHLNQKENVDEFILEEVKNTIEYSKIPVMHNASFDVLHIEQFFNIILPKFACTMVMTHMLYEELLSKSLDYVHRYFFGFGGKDTPPDMKKIINDLGWRFVPNQYLGGYCNQDAIACSRIFSRIKEPFELEYGPIFSR